ncbi:hypothetical protein [Halopseudomonas bauzanensis]|uniref:hypothetical protein n=1 Tax=Halopseudomonas bauzanensis TaxID=653930 RepID=UPI00255424AB|nr:hypothetical protein [Halopseudomonas bauzanensis]
MRPTPDPIKAGEQASIEAAVADFMRSGGSIQEFDSGCRPIKNYSWRDQGDASWSALQAGELPPRPARAAKPKRDQRKTVPKESIDRMHAARSAKYRAERDALAPAVRELAALQMSRAKIGEALDVSATTVCKIADEHGIQLPLHPRSGTRQAKANAELRREWA